MEVMAVVQDCGAPSRGGRELSGGPPPVVMDEVAPVAERSAKERPGPRSSKLVLRDIKELLDDSRLKSPTHPKKVRFWQREIRSLRTRSSQRGRSVRVRGSRAGSSPVAMEVVEDRGARGRCSRGRGVRGEGSPPVPGGAARRRCVGTPVVKEEVAPVAEPTTQERPEPHTNKLVVRDMNELMEEWRLESARHPKKMLLQQPFVFVECEESEPDPSSQTQPLSPTHPPQHSRDESINRLINYGSDEDSGDSDEEALAGPCIPRVLQSNMETPLDQDEGADDAPHADPAPNDVPLEATNQPWSWCEFDWREFPPSPIPPESRRETFSKKNVGPTTPRADPYDIFIDIWDRQIMEHIVSETNKYAQRESGLKVEERSWRDTTVDELYVYFGIILAMGVVVRTRMEEYWSSTNDIFDTPGFGAHMSIDRFLMLNKYLHFNNNDEMRAELDHSEAKLFKIQPILSHLNRKFQEMYTPARNLALDESLLMWKGCLEMSQLIPNKAAQGGIKTYEICESQTGYLWRYEVHAHKRALPQQIEDPLEASTPSIVLRLIKGLENMGYTLWMDNFYNSPCLARRLKTLGFDCVGTLRTDRKFVPSALNSLTKRDMRPGQIAGLTSGDVDVMVWRDHSRVAMISTYHGNGQRTVHNVTKPILILDYNITMGGVDRKDQILAMYPIERKRTRVWYKKLFKRLLNVSVLNSYIIHRHSSSISHRNFRLNLVRSLLSKHCSALVAGRWEPVSQVLVDVSHRLGELPMRGHQRMRRLCASCKKLTRTFCVGCNKTVCIDHCFLALHKDLNKLS